jgi:hypothetical protein
VITTEAQCIDSFADPGLRGRCMACVKKGRRTFSTEGHCSRGR